MKNKLLVSVFAMAIAVFAFTSCEPKSDVTEVCTDLMKSTLHGVAAASGDVPSAVRGFVQADGESLYFAEYEFPSKNVNDPRLLYREIAFGDGIDKPKKVEFMSYEYGEWQDRNTVFTLLVTYPTSYVLKYQGDALIDPNGRSFGGSTALNAARVEKLEKVATTFPNTDWEALFEGEYVTDSIFRKDSTWVPKPKGHWKYYDAFDHMDTVWADTTCFYSLLFDRDLATFANTGHYYRKEVRSKYDRETKEATILSEKIVEYDFRWTLAELSTDAKFTVQLKDVAAPEAAGEKLSISKYTLDSVGVASKFTLGGLEFTRPVVLPTIP